MKKSIRIMSMLLMLLMLVTTVSLVSCSNKTDDGETTTTAAGVDDQTTAKPESKYDIGDNIPETLKYGGETIPIVSRSNKWVVDEVTVENNDGGLINSAVVKRNKIVEERLGVKIENTLVDGNNYAISELIRNQAQTDHLYDIFVNSVYSTIMYTAENHFANLKELQYLDLSRPYWSQGFNEAASIGDKQYFVTGAASLSTYRFIFVTFFNSDMFKTIPEIPSLYDTVNAHQWTIDYQMEIASKFWKDMDDNPLTSEGDICGLVSNANEISVDPYWSAFKLPILTKDADNYLVYSLDIERTVSAVEKMQQLFWNTDGVCSIPHMTGDGEQEVIAKKFSENTAAMCTLRIIETEGEYLRGMKEVYGIVPIPMLNADQDDYCSYAHDQMTAWGIANDTPEDRREMLGAFLEAMASESYRNVTPAYYEVALKNKYAKDPASWQMLDIVTEKLYIDPGVLYTKQINSVHQQFRKIVGDKLGGVSSRFKTLGAATTKSVENLNKGLKALQ